MQAQQSKLDAVSNDVANANTTGYKRLRVGSSDLLYEQGGRPTISRDAQWAPVPAPSRRSFVRAGQPGPHL